MDYESSLASQVLACLKAFFADWQAKGVWAAVGGWYSAISAGDATLLASVFILMGLDLAFGLCAAVRHRVYSPYKLQRGIVKIGSYSLSIILVMILAGALNVAVGANLHVQDFFMAYLVACEILSITRHAERLGLQMPALLRRLAFGAKHRAEKGLSDAVGPLPPETSAHGDKKNIQPPQ